MNFELSFKLEAEIARTARRNQKSVKKGLRKILGAYKKSIRVQVYARDD